jgi:hypothetical protein
LPESSEHQRSTSVLGDGGVTVAFGPYGDNELGCSLGTKNPMGASQVKQTGKVHRGENRQEGEKP